MSGPESNDVEKSAAPISSGDDEKVVAEISSCDVEKSCARILSGDANSSTVSSSEVEKNSAPISKVERNFYVALVALLVASRIPSVFGGRFWAEEGTIFFHNACVLPWHKALFVSYGGYLNVVANFAGLAARYFLPIDEACYAPIAVSLVLQCFPAILLCGSELTGTFRSRLGLIAALLLIYTVPLSQEIWLSSIGSQYFLGLSVALILWLKPGNLSAELFRGLILFIAPLSGPGAIAFAPLYLIRACIDRSRGRWLQAAILILSACLQLGLFFHPAEVHDRVLGISPLLLSQIVYVKHVLVPYFGLNAQVPALAVFEAFPRNPLTYPTLWAFAYLLTLTTFGWIARKRSDIWLLISAFTAGAITYFGVLGNKETLLILQAGARYSYVPQCLCALFILSCIDARYNLVRVLSTGAILCLLFVGLRDYYVCDPTYSVGPKWRDEVHHWQADHSYKPSGWPKTWTVDFGRGE